MNNLTDIILASAKGELRELDMDDNCLIELNENNSKTIERLIENDRRYHFSKSEQDFLKLWEERDHNLSEDDWYFVVKAIAAENKTRTADRYSRLFAIYISNTNFLERLQKCDLSLVDDMLKSVVKNGGRNDKSLASKICKYISQWIYNGNAYSINDSFVRGVLPYYLKKYGIAYGDLEKLSYVGFIGLIAELESKVQVLNKNQIDHIIWYGYKSDPIRYEIARQLGKQ